MHGLTKQTQPPHSQLVLGMSLFDIIGAIAWMFSTAPINSDFVYGAAGTEATCKTQGFAFQLGFTSIFYNVSLSTYYLLGTSEVILLYAKKTVVLTMTPACSYCSRVARPALKEEPMVVARRASGCGSNPRFRWLAVLSECNFWVSHSKPSSFRRHLAPSCLLYIRSCFWCYLSHHGNDDACSLESKTTKQESLEMEIPKHHSGRCYVRTWQRSVCSS